MKLLVNRAEFQKAYSVAATVAPARSPKEILQNVRLDAGFESVLLRASDTEVGISIRATGVEVQKDGVALLSRKFQSIINESVDEFLTIESTENGIRVHGKSSKFNLATPDPITFPAPEGGDVFASAVVSGRLLSNALRRTVFAIDMDSNRYALGGVLFTIDNGIGYVIATDGRRLAVQSLGAMESSGEFPQTIIPGKAVATIEKALVGSEKVTVSGNNSSAIFAVNRQRFTPGWSKGDTRTGRWSFHGTSRLEPFRFPLVISSERPVKRRCWPISKAVA